MILEKQTEANVPTDIDRHSKGLKNKQTREQMKKHRYFQKLNILKTSFYVVLCLPEFEI